MAADSSNLALIAILGTVVTALFQLLRANTKALDKVAHSSDKVAVATTKSAKEAKDRNGHLGEQSVKLAELVMQGNVLTKQIVSELKTAGIKAEKVRVDLKDSTLEQHVDHQTVDTQTINGKK